MSSTLPNQANGHAATASGILFRPITKPGPHLGACSLRELRLEAKRGSAELAKSCGVRPFVVYQLENGHLNPALYKADLKALAKALGVPFARLMARSFKNEAEIAAMAKPTRKPKKALLALPAPAAPQEPLPAAVPVPAPAEHRTGRHQVQKIGIALTYDGNIIGGAQLNLDAKALTPLLKRLLREALSDD